MSLDIKSLKFIEKTALLALADACNYSPKARVSEETIITRARKDQRGDLKKGLKKLVSKGIAIVHPSGRNTTYQIHMEALKRIHEAMS